MFEGILKRVGYYKLIDKETSQVSGEVIEYFNNNALALVDGIDCEKLIVINNAEENKTDVFIDYVKKTNTQKFYIRKGKKNVLVLEV